MAKIYQYFAGNNFVPITPVSAGSNNYVYVNQTFSSSSWHQFVSLKTGGPTTLYYIPTTNIARVIKILHPTSEPLDFYTNISSSSGSVQYSTTMTSSSEKIGDNTLYTVNLPENCSLYICTLDYSGGSSSNQYFYYKGVTLETIGTGDPPRWNIADNYEYFNSSHSGAISPKYDEKQLQITYSLTPQNVGYVAKGWEVSPSTTYTIETVGDNTSTIQQYGSWIFRTSINDNNYTATTAISVSSSYNSSTNKTTTTLTTGSSDTYLWFGNNISSVSASSQLEALKPTLIGTLPAGWNKTIPHQRTSGSWD